MGGRQRTVGLLCAKVVIQQDGCGHTVGTEWGHEGPPREGGQGFI